MPKKTRMPSVFLGHGNPMNALSSNEWTRAWKSLGNSIDKPSAVLSISAHWYVPATAVTVNCNPRTIHDFGGFPKELYEMRYPAPGDPELAERVAALLQPERVGLSQDWGFDHGTWSVLAHVYPQANVPVVQLSIHKAKPARWHYELGKKLRPLRDEGVLVLGSGNLVHNLHTYSWGRHQQEPYDWATRFESFAREHLAAGEFDPLVDYEPLGRDARLAIPTPDHYLPLMYVLAQHQPGEPVAFPVEGFDGGSISMLSVMIG
ncbi:MAG: 4,5-DOPA dioxygenase extradiol [Woeseia sp.]